MITADGKELQDGDVFYQVFANNTDTDCASWRILKCIVENGYAYSSDWTHTRFRDIELAREFVSKQKNINTSIIENAIRHHAVNRDGKITIDEETIKKIMDLIYGDR